MLTTLLDQRVETLSNRGQKFMAAIGLFSAGIVGFCLAQDVLGNLSQNYFIKSHYVLLGLLFVGFVIGFQHSLKRALGQKPYDKIGIWTFLSHLVAFFLIGFGVAMYLEVFLHSDLWNERKIFPLLFVLYSVIGFFLGHMLASWSWIKNFWRDLKNELSRHR